jgi:hypothetical protein
LVRYSNETWKITCKKRRKAETSRLPYSAAYPVSFGHEKLVTNWGMLGNDAVGNCVLAGAGHETMLWNREASNTVIITTEDAISDYSAVTGYNPNDPNSDQGTDMQAAASYRLKTGVKDSFNKRHKIGAYVAITPGNVEEIKAAIYLFSAVGIGIQFPDYAMDEFNTGQTWHLKSGGNIVGGHYIPAVGYTSRYVYIVSWGKCIKATWGFIKRYMDEGIVYLSPEYLTNGKSLEGFDLTQLKGDLPV